VSLPPLVFTIVLVAAMVAIRKHLDKAAPAKVFVLAIEHKHGMDSFAFASREGADARLLEFVTEWWATDGPQGGDAEMPEDPKVRIDRYFHHDNQMESYSINECELAA